MMLLIALHIIPRVLYRAARASWSLVQCKKFDSILSGAYRRILNLGPTFPEALIYIPKAMHGLGLNRFSDRVQLHKWNMFHRVSSLGHIHGHAAYSLFHNMSRGLALPAPTPNYYLSSLASWLAPLNIIPSSKDPLLHEGPDRFLLPLTPMLHEFSVHAVFTDGSFSTLGNTVNDSLRSTFLRNCSAIGSSAVLFMAAPDV
jgi:hypothetical protein